jgi:carboxypeptidase Q
MKARYTFIVSLLLLFVAVSSISAQEKVYYEVVQQLMKYEFENSDVMENASWLTDVFGPRNVKTPSFLAAAEWARDRLKEYGLTNARLEPYEFGNGWGHAFTSIHMMAPQYMRVIGYPAPWTAGTDGKVRADVFPMNFDEITSEADLKQYRGKLRDRIIFIKPEQKISPHFEATPLTMTDELLDEMAKTSLTPQESVMAIELGNQERRRNRPRDEKITRQQIIDFVFAEGAVAIVHPDAQHYYGTVAPSNYNRVEKPWEDKPLQPTELVLAVEQYNRIMRILEKDIPVEMEIEIRTTVYRGEPIDHNVIAEIPGTDLAHEIVIVGGHFQSVPVGTGAIDNAAGSVTAMEAVRILKAIGVKPRRTIRVGLWGGHDGAGLAGNRSHVRKNFADREKKEYKKDYDNLSAYFDVDIGPGRIRGLNIMGNEAIRGIFSEWIKPLHSLGMSHLFTSGRYHEAYAEVGLPGFYFTHDREGSDNWNAHTNMDVYERLFPEGLMQASIVLATMAYHAAMRDEKLPRIAPYPW